MTQGDVIYAILKGGLEAGVEEIGLPLAPLDTISDALGTLNFARIEEDDDDVLNGWQVDFFYKYHSEVYGYWILKGSLWYGNYELVKHEEEC